MAESIAFGIAQTLLEKLGSAALEAISLPWGVHGELQKLKKTLTAIKAVLLDAEEQQDRNRELSHWLQEFRDACYEVEDLLDEFEIQDLRRKVLKEQGSTARKVRHFFSGSNPFLFRFRMADKIRKANEMLNEIAAIKAKFHLTEKHDMIKNAMSSERETYSFVRTSHVIGRDDDKEKIVNEFLMQSPTDGEAIPVLPIVGIGGLGKTTLAQLLFNDERVKKHFELAIWACVSQVFDIKHMMIKIIKSATGMKCKDKNKEELQKILQDCLNGQRFLLVLDDVWNEDKKKWVELTNLLAGAAQGSKMVVTTRSNQVATITGTVPQYDLENLSNEDSLSLFLKLAFKEGEEKQHPNLVRLGEEIVQKCKGVALAVNTLASHLCLTKVENDWKHIRDSELWTLKQRENDILPALKLSYDHLPWYLKQCFAYCSVYPKGHEFHSVHLVSLWMALGLLQSSNKNEELEDIGNRYIHELWSRSFFQEVEDYLVLSTFKMHDLVHDLALSVTKNDRQIGSDLLRKGASELPNNLGHLRAFVSPREKPETRNESLTATCISRAKGVRLLDLEEACLQELPNSVRYLEHLKYLSIDDNHNIKKLPNFICNLQSLQTLSFAGCVGIEELPKDIRYLICLRTLMITTKQTSLQETGIGCLTSLRLFMIDNCENLKNLFEDMQSLTALRTLLISSCKNLVSLPQGLKYLTALETLMIADCEKLDLISNSNGLEFGVGKEDRGSLRELLIVGLPKLESLPQWILLGSTTTLQHLYISRCENLSTLPTWFQHLISLQKLDIGDCPKLSSLPEGMQHLSALKVLRINGCPTLSQRCLKETGEDWPKIAHVPTLYLLDLDLSSSDDE